MDENLVAEYVTKGTEAYAKIQNFPVPVIAVINGYAYGAGFELTLACDLRFMSKKAQIGQPAAKHGLIPPFGGVFRLPQIVGAGIAKEIVFSSMEITPEDGFRMGLINRIYEPEELMAETLKYAEIVCKTKRYSVAKIKDLMNKELLEGYNAEVENNALIDCIKNPQTKAQLMSFFKKD